MSQWHSSWDEFFATQQPRILEIERALASRNFTPPRDRWFAAFNTPISTISVVILGQDPYPTAGVAQGLAFSVPSHSKLPASLRNIFQEIHTDLSTPLRTNGNLADWVEQGVWLLNPVLTTEIGESNSHRNLGWQALTTAAIEFVVAKQPPGVAILWGKSANKLHDYFHRWEILQSAHPSPLSASRGFFGSRPFSKTNQYLLSQNRSPINWG